MEKLTYRRNDRTFPDQKIQSVQAERFMDIHLRDQTPGRNILEGLCFDRQNYLYVCVPVQGDILKISIETKKTVLQIHLPQHMLPSALKVHRDGRLFITCVNSDEGSLIAVLSPEGKLLQKIPMKGRHIDDMVFDHTGGFYCSDLSGTFENPCGGIFYVESDLKTVHSVISSGLIKSNGIVLTPDEKALYFTEFGAGRLDRITFGYDAFSENPCKPFVVYHFTGMEGPDSMVIDADGNLYVSLTGQGRYLVFNQNAFPIGEILIPERTEGRMLKSTHITICPGTDIAYMCTADMQDGSAAIYRTQVYAGAYRGFAYQE